LAQQGKLNFDPDAAPAAADLSVTTKLAPATLIQNVSKPYIIVTLKHYVDAPRHQDLEFEPSEGVGSSFRHADLDKRDLTAPLDGMIRSQSIIGTKFALENMMFEDEDDTFINRASETFGRLGLKKAASEVPPLAAATGGGMLE
jgi:hypothetical protein